MGFGGYGWEYVGICGGKWVTPRPLRPAESNGIGIKTCVKIMELLGGEFKVLNDGEYYTVIVKLPATLAEENNADLTNS